MKNKSIIIKIKNIYFKVRNFLIYLVVLFFVIIIPCFIEDAIKAIPIKSSFTDDVWFQFYGSYLGTIVAALIFALTLYCNKLDRKEESKQKRKNEFIKYRLDICKNFYNLLMINDYDIRNANIDNELFSKYDCSKTLY